jgi:histidinol-phosphate aminotransferase
MAGALAALQDQSYLKQTVAQIEASKALIVEITQAHGLTCLRSHTNFVAIDCGRDEAFAVSVMNELLERGIFVRKPAVAPQNRAIRVSCGPKDAMDAFDEAFAATMINLT